MGASTGVPAAAAMCAASLKYVSEHPELLLRLRANTAHLKSGLRSLGLLVPGDDVAPIAAFALPGRSMPALQAELMSQGIFVYHSSYIGAGSGGVIRCGVFADHTSEHIDTLLRALRQLL
jgi:7-keto-8-aminopelargonate synthetase-like enzyme